MGFFVLVGVIGIGIVVATVVTAVQRNAQLTAWKAAAATLGMELEPGSLGQQMRLSGSISGFASEVTVHRQSSGKSSALFTKYRVSYPPLGLGLRLARESGYTKLVRFLGAQDHQIGDEQFDAAFEVKANDPAAVAAYLTPGRREAMLRLLVSHPEVVIADDETTLLRPGVDRDPDVLTSTVRRLAAAAGTLTDARLAERIRAKIEQRAAGDLAATAPPANVHPHPDDVDEALLAVEGLHGAGRREEATALAERLTAALPTDPDVVGLHAQVSQPPPLPEPRAPSTDPVAIARDLFGEHRLSFETTQRFEERFVGTPVEWRGVVRRSTDVAADHDFDGDAVTKAVVHVATIANDLYGQAEVDAIVAFPHGTKLAEGAEISFRGRLVAVDGLIRNLFVAGGELA